MILALLACGPGSVVMKGDTAVADDTAGDSTVDTVDTVDSVDTGQEEVSICGNMSGVASATTRWAYEYSMPQVNSTRERLVTSLEGDRVVIEDVQVTTAANYSYTYTYTYDYRCDESGMWLLGTQVLQVSVSAGNEYESGYDIAYNQPVQVAPAVAEFGSSWTSVYDGVYVYSNGMESPFTYTYLNTVVGADATELPIGNVTVFRVIAEMGGSGTTTYYGDEIGLVQDTQWLISDYDP